MKHLLLASVLGLALVGCGGGDDSKGEPKLTGKVESVPLPAGSKSPDDKLKEAEQQRAAQAAANNGENDKGVSEGGN